MKLVDGGIIVPFAVSLFFSEEYHADGWLCPALFKYFRRAPKEIYVKAEAK